MVTEQASEHNLSDLSGSPSIVSTERLLNLLELSNSDLTASTGMEELPISEMLLDTLLSLLQSERPELLAHSQRVAFLCYGMGRQFGWTTKRTNTLVTAALLHELGTLANPQPQRFWEIPESEEELSRFVTIDLLESCHADSDLLEILAHSIQFRYRELRPEESDYPTPEHVLLGAAAFQFAHLFEQVRHLGGGAHHLSEIVAALQSVAEIPSEQQAVAALEEWLTGRDKIIHSFDPAMFFPNNQNMDEETAAFVRSTFIEILQELYKLQNNYDAFFILDSTGRFQLWNSGCQLHHGYTIREMRNKHWHNSLIGYCNHEGLSFSDAQTPLFQTLESGKPAQTTLFLKQGEHSFVEADVVSIPIMGRDRLMLGIVELHRISGAQDQSVQEVLYTAEWISELAGELRRVSQEDPEAHAIPRLDDELVSILESRLGIAPQIEAQTLTGAEVDVVDDAEEASSRIDLDEDDSPVDTAIELDPADSDILTTEEVARSNAPEPAEIELTESDTTLGSVESDTVASEEQQHADSVASDTSLHSGEDADELGDTAYELVLGEEDESDDDLPDLGSHLDNLLSRFDDIVSESGVSDEAHAEEPAAADPEHMDDIEAVDTVLETEDLAVPPVEEADFELNPDVEQRQEDASATSDDKTEVAPEAYEVDSATPHAPDVEEATPELTFAGVDETESADEATESEFNEDDALAALMGSSDETEEASAGIAEEHSGDLLDEQPAGEPESMETADASSVLDDELDFELDPDIEVTDSELLQALQDEEVAVEFESESSETVQENSEVIAQDSGAYLISGEESETEESDSQSSEFSLEAVTDSTEESAQETQAEKPEVVPEEPITERAEEAPEESVTEQAADVHEEPVAEQAQEVPEEPIAERAEEAPQESVTEQAADVHEEPVAEQAEEVPEEPIAERAEEAPQESVTEQTADVHEEPVTEQAEEAPQESVAEQAEEVHEEPVTEQAEEAPQEPVAEQAEEVPQEPIAEQAEEAPQESVTEQAADVHEEPVAEQAEEVPQEPVAEEAEESPVVVEPLSPSVEEPADQIEDKSVAEPEPVPVGAVGEEKHQEPSEEPDDSELQAAPVSRTEWDAFVSYLLDLNSADHEAVAVLFLDLDRFKAINEGFGRQIGDDLLKEIAGRLSEACGKRELSCRYGGGQFAVSCPGLTLEKASKRADQVRKLIERTRFDVLPFQALTVSIGVAGSEPGDTITELMNRAEHSLYNAKRSGRNCVVALSSEQIQAELAEEEQITEVAGDKPFEVVSEFEAMIASDMIVYKLGGFLYDMHAKLLHVDKRHVSMRVGSKGFLPYWGRQDDARPVLIDLELGEGWGGQKDGRKPTKSSVIHIRIRPDGWVRNQETFLKRAQHVLRELKGYFAGS